MFFAKRSRFVGESSPLKMGRTLSLRFGQETTRDEFSRGRDLLPIASSEPWWWRTSRKTSPSPTAPRPTSRSRRGFSVSWIGPSAWWRSFRRCGSSTPPNTSPASSLRRDRYKSDRAPLIRVLEPSSGRHFISRSVSSAHAQFPNASNLDNFQGHSPSRDGSIHSCCGRIKSAPHFGFAIWRTALDLA